MPQLTEQLQRVSAYYGTPEWMNRDYQEASRAILGAEYGRAIGLLKNVTQDGKDRSVQVKPGRCSRTWNNRRPAG